MLKKGDRVRITKPKQVTVRNNEICWAIAMDKYDGATTLIVEAISITAYLVKIDEGIYLWHKDWLGLV